MCVRLTFIPLGWVFEFWCMVYEKCEYYTNRKRYSYEVNDILWKIKHWFCSVR